MRREELDFRELFRVLKRRRLAFLSLFILVYSVILTATFTVTPIYRAVTRIYIDPGAYTQIDLKSQQPIDTEWYLHTQMGLLKSHLVAGKVVSQLGLYMAENKTHSLASLFGLGGQQPSSNAGKRMEAIRKFMDKLDVRPDKSSSLLKVSYEDKDPRLAAAAVNTAVQALIDLNLEIKVNPSQELTGWLDEKVNETKNKMTESSNRLQDFKREKGLVTDDGRDTSLQALTDLSSKALAAEARRYEAEARYQRALALSKDPEKILSYPDVLNNPTIQALMTQQGVLAREIAENSGRYGDKHPQMVRLESEMGNLKKQMQGEAILIVGTMKNEYESALRDEQRLKKALENQKSEAMDYDKHSNEYDLKKQDVAASRELYEALLKSSEETNVMGSIGAGGVQILDRATAPSSPEWPRKKLSVVVGFIVSMFAGVAFAFFFEKIDNTCKSPKDIEEVLGLPLLGIIPTSRSLSGKRNAGALDVILKPVSPVAEVFRNIMGCMLLTTRNAPPKVIQLCSAEHSEGKSTVACNLACALAAMGEKVLLIDCDLRKPKIHKVLNVPNMQGLSDLLAHRAALAKVIKSTLVPGLFVITSGPVSTNPCELLSSQAMKDTIVLLKEIYDRIILDSPAFLEVADSSITAALSDGIILVVSSGRTTRKKVLRTKKSIIGLDTKILGAVLNDQAKKSAEYYKSYNYNYNHYSGENAPDMQIGGVNTLLKMGAASDE